MTDNNSSKHRKQMKQRYIEEINDYQALLAVSEAKANIDELMAKAKVYDSMKKKTSMTRANSKTLKQEAFSAMMAFSVLSDFVKNKELLKTHIKPEKLEEMRIRLEEEMIEHN